MWQSGENHDHSCSLGVELRRMPSASATVTSMAMASFIHTLNQIDTHLKCTIYLQSCQSTRNNPKLRRCDKDTFIWCMNYNERASNVQYCRRLMTFSIEYYLQSPTANNTHFNTYWKRKKKHMEKQTDCVHTETIQTEVLVNLKWSNKNMVAIREYKSYSVKRRIRNDNIIFYKLYVTYAYLTICACVRTNRHAAHS